MLADDGRDRSASGFIERTGAVEETRASAQCVIHGRTAARYHGANDVRASGASGEVNVAMDNDKAVPVNSAVYGQIAVNDQNASPT